MNNKYFITASGTGVGKTLVTTGLYWQLNQAGHKVKALKPLASGYDTHDPESDTALILKCGGLDKTMAYSISPWKFSAPLAPNLAAELEGKTVPFMELLEFCRNSSENDGYTLIEGVGGVMAPIDDSHSVIDWISEIGWPVICVGGSYLGAMSHTLTAITALRTRNIPIHAIVISESDKEEVTLSDTVNTLKKFIPKDIPIVSIPRLVTSEEAWKQVPHLIDLLK